MKHVFLGSLYRKENHYIGVRPRDRYNSNYYGWSDYKDEAEKYNQETEKMGLSRWSITPLKIDEDRHDYLGSIFSEHTFVKNITIEVSTELIRELDINESVYIKGESFNILQKAYGIEGEIIYYTDYSEIEEDDNSKQKAIEELEKRKEYLSSKGQYENREEMECQKEENLVQNSVHLRFDDRLQNSNIKQKKGFWRWLFYPEE